MGAITILSPIGFGTGDSRAEVFHCVWVLPPGVSFHWAYLEAATPRSKTVRRVYDTRDPRMQLSPQAIECVSHQFKEYSSAAAAHTGQRSLKFV